MITRIQKWGNSQGIRIAKGVLAELGLNVGDEVNISVTGQEIKISPVRKRRVRYNLDDLVKRIPKDYTPIEVDWGKPVGREAW